MRPAQDFYATSLFSLMSIFFDSYFVKRLYAISSISNLDADLPIYAKILII